MSVSADVTVATKDGTRRSPAEPPTAAAPVQAPGRLAVAHARAPAALEVGCHPRARALRVCLAVPRLHRTVLSPLLPPQKRRPGPEEPTNTWQLRVKTAMAGVKLVLLGRTVLQEIQAGCVFSQHTLCVHVCVCACVTLTPVFLRLLSASVSPGLRCDVTAWLCGPVAGRGHSGFRGAHETCSSRLPASGCRSR